MKIRILAIVGILFFQGISETAAHSNRMCKRVVSNKVEKVEKTLKKEGNSNEDVCVSRNRYSYRVQATYLHLAVLYNHKEMVELFLNHGTNINVRAT